MTRPFSVPDLESLSELARAFAKAYPALAPRLAETSFDPDVERLLEAFAHLTEHVRKLVDDSAPVAAQFFADLLAPELARPFPAATILEFSPSPLGVRRFVPEGAEVESAPIDGTPCRFRAWSAFAILPWSVDDARVTWSPTEGQSLEVSFSAANDGFSLGNTLDSLFPLRLHWGGDSRAAMTLLLFLRCHLVAIELRVGESDSWLPLGSQVMPWGFSSEESLLPREPFEHPGLRLLRE